MKKRTLPILLLCVCLLTAVLSACGNTDGTAAQAAASSVASPSPSKPELSQEPVTITLAEQFVSGERTAILRQIADKYEADHSNVSIQVRTVQTEAEIEALLKSGEADIAELNGDTLFAYADKNLLEDVSYDLKYWDETYTLTAAAQNVMGVYDHDAIYFIPHTIHQLALCYRTDMLQAADPDFREHLLATWEDLYGYGKKTMDSGNAEYGLLMNMEGGVYTLADMLMWSYLGNWRIVAPYHGYFKMGNSGETVFTLEEAKNGLEMFRDIVNDLMPSLSHEALGSGAADAFIDGLAAMIVASPSDIYRIEQEMDEELWAEIPLPREKNTGQAFFSNGFEGWGISAAAGDRDRTVDFLLFLSGSDNNTHFVKNTGGIPVHTDAREKDDFFIDTGLNIFMVLSKRPGTYQFATAPKMYDAFEAYEREIDGKYEQYLTGSLSGDDLLAELDDYWRKAYETQGQIWPFIEMKSDSSLLEKE